MKKTSVACATIIAAGALILSGCTSTGPDAAPSSSAAAPTTAATTAAPEESTPAPEASDEPTDAATGELEITPASSKTVTDPELEDTATVTGIAFGFTGSGDWAEAPGGATYVGVEFTVSHGEKYYGGAGCNDLQLSTPDSGTPTTGINSSVKDDMIAQGLTPLDKIDNGGSASGWCMYYVENPTKDNLTITFSRSAAKAGDTEIAAFEEAMPITAE